MGQEGCPVRGFSCCLLRQGGLRLAVGVSVKWSHEDGSVVIRGVIVGSRNLSAKASENKLNEVKGRIRLRIGDIGDIKDCPCPNSNAKSFFDPMNS